MKKIWMSLILITLFTSSLWGQAWGCPIEKKWIRNGVEKTYTLEIDESHRGKTWSRKDWEFQHSYDVTVSNIIFVDTVVDKSYNVDDYIYYCAENDFESVIYYTLFTTAKGYAAAQITLDDNLVYRCDYIEDTESGTYYYAVWAYVM